MKIVFPHSKLIASMQGMAFRQGEAVKHGAPVIVPEYPWEGVLTYVYGSVLKRKRYRLWYQANGVYVAYARSPDGIRWQKPLVSRFKIDQPQLGPTVTLAEGGGALGASPKTSARVKSNVVFDLHMPSLLHDPDDRERPYKLFGYRETGYCAAFSKDAIHFTPGADDIERRWRTNFRGFVVLDVTIENARLYSLEVT